MRIRCDLRNKIKDAQATMPMEGFMARQRKNIYERNKRWWEYRYEKDRSSARKTKHGYSYSKSHKGGKQKVTGVGTTSTELPLHQQAPELFEVYCDAWLNEKSASIKQSTYVKYEIIIEKHIKPFLGGYYFSEITEKHFLGFEDQLAKNLSSKTIRDILTVLKAVFKFVQKKRHLYNTEFDFPMPRVVRYEMRVLSEEEEKKLIRYLLCTIDACKFGIVLSTMTGLRIGEICALKWENISIPDGTLKVDSTLQRLKTSSKEAHKTVVVTGTPKSSASVRTIPMTKECIELCIKMVAEPDAFVLTGTTDYMEPRALQYRLKKYTTDCGLQDVHFHTLRHTFATRCVEAGFEIKSLSEILGHSSTTVTLDRYVHSSMQLKRANMDKLSSYHACF